MCTSPDTVSWAASLHLKPPPSQRKVNAGLAWWYRGLSCGLQRWHIISEHQLEFRPDALLPIQAPADAPGKPMEDGSSTRVPAIHVGHLERVPGSWLWPRRVLAAVPGSESADERSLPHLSYRSSLLTLSFKQSNQ